LRSGNYCGNKHTDFAGGYSKQGMPRSSVNNALGEWVSCETDMGPVPRGTPGLCMKDCMNVTDDSGVDCLLFWPNHDVDKGKQDGNVWMLGQSSKCKIIRGPKWQTWPGGTKGKEMAEKVLDSIFAQGRHVPVCRCLSMLMTEGKTGTAVVDGKGEGAWRKAA
jgi:hypothetical protein